MNISDEELCTSLMRVFALLRRSFDRAMTEQGASLAQTKVLMCIRARSGMMRAADIAEILDVVPRTVTEALDGLERDGLIQRTPDADDRRVKRLAITPAGEAAVAVTEPLRKALSARAMAPLDPVERQQLYAAMQKLWMGLSEA